MVVKLILAALMLTAFVWFLNDPWNPGWFSVGLMAVALHLMIKEMNGRGMR